MKYKNKSSLQASLPSELTVGTNADVSTAKLMDAVAATPGTVKLGDKKLDKTNLEMLKLHFRKMIVRRFNQKYN